MINKCIVQGRLTHDPELRSTPNGVPVASFTVAWSEKHGNSESSLFLNCVAWRNSAEFVSRHFRKGQEIVVEGNLASRKWQDKNGNNRQTVELITDSMHFCGPKKQDALDDLENEAAKFEDLSEDDSDLPF